jgi:hypothetical protein
MTIRHLNKPLNVESGDNKINKNVSLEGILFDKPKKTSILSSPQNFFFLLLICAYKAWVISPSCPHPLPYHPLCPLPLPTPSIPSRNYFALISNFVVERV